MVKIAIWETGEIIEFNGTVEEFVEKTKKILEETDEEGDDNERS